MVKANSKFSTHCLFILYNFYSSTKLQNG